MELSSRLSESPCPKDRRHYRQLRAVGLVSLTASSVLKFAPRTCRSRSCPGTDSNRDKPRRLRLTGSCTTKLTTHNARIGSTKKKVPHGRHVGSALSGSCKVLAQRKKFQGPLPFCPTSFWLVLFLLLLSFFPPLDNRPAGQPEHQTTKSHYHSIFQQLQATQIQTSSIPAYLSKMFSVVAEL